MPGKVNMDTKKMRQNAASAAAFVKLFSNKTRLLILCLLVEGERSVSELADDCGLSQSAVSQHLARLRDSELVTTRRDARSIYYSISSDEARRLTSLLYDMFCR